LGGESWPTEREKKEEDAWGGREREGQ